MASMWDSVIGLGSNVGDRLGNLRAALHALGELGSLVAVSALYDTAPVGPHQARFLNAAARLDTGMEPRALLPALLAIEQRLGRERRERWGPRTLDLDMLWVGGFMCDDVGLTVPHPELRRRAFALVPLLDVAPDASDPRDGAAYARVSVELDLREVREVEGSRDRWFRELRQRA
jgi:2-amino-4-hydroxy-6-hydroxymethyldihydropteridine diphosphokinase